MEDITIPVWFTAWVGTTCKQLVHMIQNDQKLEFHRQQYSCKWKKRRKKMKLPLLHVQLSFSFNRTIIKIIIWQVPATLVFTYQDFIEAIYKRENNPSEQRAQSHNIRLVFNGMTNPGRYCAIKHISCKKPKQNKPVWKPSRVLFNRVAERTYYKTSSSRNLFGIHLT